MLLDDAIVEIPLHNGLRHYWSFNDTVGDWTDIVHALGPVPVMFTGGGSPSVVAGLEGNAVRMESASSEYLEDINGVFAKGVNPLGSGNWTMAGWWKLRSLASIQDLLWRWDTTLGEREFFLNFNSTSQAIRFGGSSDGSAFDADVFNLQTSGNIPQDDWIFVAVRRSGSQLHLSINQSGVSSTNIGSTYSFHPSTRNLLMGGAEDNGVTVRWSDIDVDRFGFWDRSLSNAELNELYNGGAGLPYPFKTLGELDTLASGVISCYRMGWGNTQRGFDVITESRNDLTQNNNPNPIVGAVGSGTEFNGTSHWYELLDASAADWEIGNREWTAGIIFKPENTEAVPFPIAKNNETGTGGNGTEWNLILARGPDRIAFRAGHPTLSETHTVATSGVDAGAPNGVDWDDGEFHSVVWGFLPGSGQFIQLDDGPRIFNTTLASTGTNVGNADFTIGRRDHATPQWFKGIIDSVHLWHRVLTVSEARRFNGA